MDHYPKNRQSHLHRRKNKQGGQGPQQQRQDYDDHEQIAGQHYNDQYVSHKPAKVADKLLWYLKFIERYKWMIVIVLTAMFCTHALHKWSDYSEMYKSQIKSLNEQIEGLKDDKEQCRRNLDSQMVKLKDELKRKEEHNKELTTTNSQLSYNAQMMRDDCKAELNHCRQLYQTEKEDKENKNDQLHSKILEVTRCEDQLQICRVYQLQQCQDQVQKMELDVSNDNELLIELRRCQTKARHVTIDLGDCKSDYKVCSDKLDNYKHERCLGFRI